MGDLEKEAEVEGHGDGHGMTVGMVGMVEVMVAVMGMQMKVTRIMATELGTVTHRRRVGMTVASIRSPLCERARFCHESWPCGCSPSGHSHPREERSSESRRFWQSRITHSSTSSMR